MALPPFFPEGGESINLPFEQKEVSPPPISLPCYSSESPKLDKTDRQHMKRSVARTAFKTEWVPGRVPLENCLCYSLDPKELPIQMAEEEGTMYSGNLVCSKLCKAAFSGSRCLLARSGAAGRSAKPALSLARSAAARNGKPTARLYWLRPFWRLCVSRSWKAGSS